MPDPSPIVAILNSYASATGANRCQVILRADGTALVFGDDPDLAPRDLAQLTAALGGPACHRSTLPTFLPNASARRETLPSSLASLRALRLELARLELAALEEDLKAA